MFIKPPVLGRNHRLGQMGRHIPQQYGRAHHLPPAADDLPVRAGKGYAGAGPVLIKDGCVRQIIGVPGKQARQPDHAPKAAYQQPVKPPPDEAALFAFFRHLSFYREAGAAPRHSLAIPHGSNIQIRHF
jgi:hypothetical protein